MKNTTLTLRLSPDLKSQASDTFEKVGLDLSSAITIFLTKAVKVHGIPFLVTDTPTEEDPIPNAETVAAIEEAKKLEKDPHAKRYTDVDQLFRDLLK